MRRVLAGVLMTIANICLGLAMTGWWLQHTVFDPGRSQDVAEQVLAVDGVQAQITDAIVDAVAVELGQDPDTIALLVGQASETAGGVTLLTDVVVQSHAVIIGEAEGPVTITPQQLAELLGDERALLLPPIALPVTTIEPIDWLRQVLDATVVWAFVLAVVLALLALTIHPRRDRMVRRWGLGLIVLAAIVMVVGYVLPVVVLPTLTTSPWVQAIPELAQSQLGLLAGASLVCAGVGLGLIVVAGLMRRAQMERDRPPAPRPAPQTWG
jgi:hypothetical protein